MSRPDDMKKPQIGARARLRCAVDRYPHFRVEQGAAGTITHADEWLIALRMDEHVAGAESWDNELCWTPEDGDFIDDLRGGATLEDRIIAAFHRDVDIIEVAS